MKRQDEYAAELGRRVIAALAPQELPLVTVFARWARYGLGRSVSRRSLNRRESLGRRGCSLALDQRAAGAVGSRVDGVAGGA